MFDRTEYWWKIWRKTDLRFKKWYEEFGKFSPDHSKVSKLGLWWDPFIQSRKLMSLKFTGKLCVISLMEWCKIRRGISLSLQVLTSGIWRILTRTLKTLRNLHFNGLLLTKVYNIRAKKVQRTRTYVWWFWILIQNLKENWLVLSKMAWRIWLIFVHSLKNSNFILESKMGELNQNQNSKQPDQPDAVWRLYFTLEINE